MSEHSRRPGGRATRFTLGHSHELLTEILSRAATPADLLISRFFAARRYLGSHDRGFIADTVYAALRNTIRYRTLFSDLLAGVDHDLEASVFIAAHRIEEGSEEGWETLSEGADLSIEELKTIADHLRAGIEHVKTLADPERTAIEQSMPTWFAERVLAQYGADEGRELLAAMNVQAPIVLRANTLRADRETLIAALEAQGIAAFPGRYAPDAVVLRRRMNANAIPEFKQGYFELQDEGSQLLSAILDPHPNWRVFDPCAGSGGKSLHLAAIMKGRGEVVAHDTNERRLSEIRPRLRRSGAQNIRVLDHENYFRQRMKLVESFNAVLIDAPCTGTGVLRRNPGSRLTLDIEVLERIVSEQSAILDEYSRTVKPGGLLLYATCSVLHEEGEDQVARFLSENEGWSLEAPNAPAEMITPEGYFRCSPHRHGTDGFFGALMRRASS